MTEQAQGTGTPPPGLDVVHADAHLIVLNKPANLLSVPGKGPDKSDCLSARAQAIWPDALTVHRLDMATSGLLVMARGAQAQRTLSMAFAQRLTHKQYEAVAAGCLHENPLQTDAAGWQHIDLPLTVDWPNRPRSKVDWDIGKPSTTRWQVLESLPDATRVALEPITGRSHQLRVHLLALGHPILGDALYQGAAAAAFPRLMLHACRLALPHPTHGKLLQFHSPAPF